jgi:hypothetical protein
VVLDQGPVEVGVQRVRGCVPIRSWRASLTEGKCGATWIDRKISSPRPRVMFDTVSFAKFRSSADLLSLTKTLYQPPMGRLLNSDEEFETIGRRQLTTQEYIFSTQYDFD